VRVKDILVQTGANMHTVAPASSVQRAARLLAKHRIGALVISADGYQADGIISERDIVRGIGESGQEFLRRKVGAVCFHKVQTCAPPDEVSRVLQTMRQYRVRHMPVVNKGKLVGMVSIVDILRAQAGRASLR